jgi:multidrug efflux pump subunit AcrB
MPSDSARVAHRQQNLLRDPRGAAERVRQDRDAAEAVRGSSNCTIVPLSTLVHQTTVPMQPLAINHQSQFPSVTISFNVNGNASLGDAFTQVQQVEASMGMPPSVQGRFQGTAQAFQSSLSTEPYLVAARMCAGTSN